MKNILTLLVKDNAELHFRDYPETLIKSANNWLASYTGNPPNELLHVFHIVQDALYKYYETKHLVYALIIQLALMEAEEIEIARDSDNPYNNMKTMEVHSGVIITNLPKFS